MNLNIDLQTFLQKLEARNPVHVNYKTDGCTWYYIDGETKINICHNRTYWGVAIQTKRIMTPAQMFAGIYKETIESYWTNTLYTDKILADQEALQYGGEVIEEFYCDEDNPAWFISFDDFDKMAIFMHYKLTEGQ